MRVEFNKNKLKHDISDRYGTQVKVANELLIGRKTLGHILNGKRINFMTLYAICSVIGTKPDEYVTEAGWNE